MFEDPVCTNLSICTIDVSVSLFWHGTDCAMIPFCCSSRPAHNFDFKSMVTVSVVLYLCSELYRNGQIQKYLQLEVNFT